MVCKGVAAETVHVKRESAHGLWPEAAAAGLGQTQRFGQHGQAPLPADVHASLMSAWVSGSRDWEDAGIWHAPGQHAPDPCSLGAHR